MNDTIKLFDAHTHLHELLPYISDAVEYANQNHVIKFSCCGTNDDDWEIVEAFAHKYSNIYPAFGLHPWFVMNASHCWLDKLQKLLSHNSNASIGECGLDGIHLQTPIKEQKKALIAQIELAIQYKRPIIFHCVNLENMLYSLIKQYQFPRNFLIHAYRLDSNYTKRFAELGCYFSIGTNILKRSAKRIHDIVSHIPPDRIVLETDSPSLTPPSEYCLRKLYKDNSLTHRYNEPANLILLLQTISNIMQIDLQTFSQKTFMNAEYFFT